MKTSDKIILITTVTIAVLLVAAVVITGVYLYGSMLPIDKADNGTWKKTDFSFAVGAFSGIKASGAWDIELVKADTCAVTVTAPEALTGYIKPQVDARGTLDLNQWFLGDPLTMKIKTVVSMPDITFIETSGPATVKFSGFTGKKLELRVMDMSSVTGADSSIEELTVNGTGTARIDLGGCSSVNARVNLPWTGSITLRMNGGKLSGQILGLSKLVWSGTVQEMDLEATAMAKIIKTR